jgi:hypothetical protein
MQAIKPFALAALLAASLVACGGAGDDAAAPATDDTNEINKAKLQVFECKTDSKVDDAIQTMTFSVKNITDNKKVEVLDKNGRAADDDMPIHVLPEGRVSALNENIGVSSGTRTLRISGDSDGFFLLTLVLFKDSGYTKGYIRIYGSEDDGPHQYSKVSCTVAQK